MSVNWKKLFDWSVVRVSRPYAIGQADEYNVPYAYGVDVEYKYHGNMREVFVVGEDRMLISGQRLALRRAIEYYLGRRKKIK